MGTESEEPHSPSGSSRTADNHQLPRQSLCAGARGTLHGRSRSDSTLPLRNSDFLGKAKIA